MIFLTRITTVILARKICGEVQSLKLNSDFYFVSEENRDYMWEPDLNPDGDFGWEWYFRYNNHIPGYSEAQLKGMDSQADLR